MASSHGSKCEDLINPEKNVLLLRLLFHAPETHLSAIFHLNINLKYKIDSQHFKNIFAAWSIQYMETCTFSLFHNSVFI